MLYNFIGEKTVVNTDGSVSNGEFIFYSDFGEFCDKVYPNWLTEEAAQSTAPVNDNPICDRGSCSHYDPTDDDTWKYKDDPVLSEE